MIILDQNRLNFSYNESLFDYSKILPRKKKKEVRKIEIYYNDDVVIKKGNKNKIISFNTLQKLRVIDPDKDYSFDIKSFLLKMSIEL